MKACEQRAAAVLRRLQGIEAPVMAELGFGAGKMAREILRDDRVHLHTVDNFLTGCDQPEHYIATRDNFAKRDREAAEKHLAAARRLEAEHAGRMTLHVGCTSDVADSFADGSLDMVFIDADHSFEAVQFDIIWWKPKVRTGGWIGGHDYDNQDPRFDFSGVKRAVDLFCDCFEKDLEVDDNFTWFVRL